MPHAPRPTSARIARRLRVEGLEDRRLMATLPAGFTEVALATGIDGPSAMEIAPDGRLWVLEQAGRVKVFSGGPSGATALTIPPSALSGAGERGLLGIAFDPSYDIASPAPDFVYLYYTSTASPTPHNRISRFVVDNTNPDSPVLSGETVLVDLDGLTATNHNGGAIHFGPDGKLYVGVGENANGSNAQDLTNRLGKILRYNADGTIPADNPTSFAGIAGTTSGANRAIWAVGLRNPFTFAFQPGTGRMFINDVGASLAEEINVGQAGANYGWPRTEGDFDQAAFPDFTRPFYAYTHGDGTFQGSAITGGAFYNPAAGGVARFPSLYDGDYFFADSGNDWINVIDVGTGAVSRFASDVSAVVDLRVAADGSLLYLSRGTGSVFRVAPIPGQPPTLLQQPQAQVVAAGATATFAVVATGADPLAYQWERAEAGTTVFVAIPGATGPSLALANAQASDNGDLFRVIVANAFGVQVSAAAPLAVTAAPRRPTVPADYDGDGRSDLAVYLPAFGTLPYRPSSGGPAVAVKFGKAGAGRTIPTGGDYDGDGRTDVAVYLVRQGVYTYRPSGGGPDVAIPIGRAGAGRTIPVPGDYDGDGRTDVAVYLPATGVFLIRSSAGGPDQTITYSGGGRKLPAPADYNGDGRTDVAVYLQALGAFAIRPDDGGEDVIVPFGRRGTGKSIPVPADYDGDGKADLAVYLPATGQFSYRPSGGGPDVLVRIGGAGRGKVPVPGDYSGSGRIEPATFAPRTATFAYLPAAGGPAVSARFGKRGVGRSLPAAEVPAAVASSATPGRRAANRAATVTTRMALPRRPAVLDPRGVLASGGGDAR